MQLFTVKQNKNATKRTENREPIPPSHRNLWQANSERAAANSSLEAAVESLSSMPILQIFWGARQHLRCYSTHNATSDEDHAKVRRDSATNTATVSHLQPWSLFVHSTVRGFLLLIVMIHHLSHSGQLQRNLVIINTFGDSQNLQ